MSALPGTWERHVKENASYEEHQTGNSQSSSSSDPKLVLEEILNIRQREPFQNGKLKFSKSAPPIGDAQISEVLTSIPFPKRVWNLNNYRTENRTLKGERNGFR